jgi:hypothetical protein
LYLSPIIICGLGVINLHNMSRSLISKWLWKFRDSNDNAFWKEFISKHYYNGSYNLYHISPSMYNKLSYFWKSILKCCDIFNLGINIIVHSGNNTSFWHDSWISSIPLKNEFKDLYDICNFKFALIYDVFNSDSDPPWIFNFNRILVGSTLRQLYLLYAKLNLYNIDNDNDYISWEWDKSKKFSSNSFYKFINFSGTSVNCFKFIWKSNAPPKSKIHMWLIIHGKLNTIEFLKKKNIIIDNKCYFCNSHSEDINHIYYDCFDTHYILIMTLNIFEFNISTRISDCFFYWDSFRFLFDKDFRFLLDTLFIISCWFIWFERNQRIFNNKNQH